MLSVTKRTGDTVPFDSTKIYRAIAAANNDVKSQPDLTAMENHQLDATALAVVTQLKKDERNFSVEEIQDAVEKELMKTNPDVAKSYILYREKHRERRDAAENLMNSYNGLLFADAEEMDLKRDNANINTDAPMGIMLKLGTEGAKNFVDHHVLDKEAYEADSQNWIHIHDKDFSLITFNCCQIDLGKLLKGGFSTGHGFLREPNSIRAAASLACIAVQSNQNDMFGGQSINALDYALAPYVDKSFKKAFARNFSKAYRGIHNHVAREAIGKKLEHKTVKVSMKDMPEVLKVAMFTEPPVYSSTCIASDGENQIYKMQRIARELYSDKYDVDTMSIIYEAIQEAYFDAVNDAEEETKQAMEAMIHNFNTLHSRAGAQVPFSSLNFGMDISPEGRLVSKYLLLAQEAGLGHGETAIFPITVFQMKKGVNCNEDDPNYDLFKLACRVSAKRLFPNFVNLDAPYNLQYYKPGDYNSYVATMGCRTRVMSNVNGPEESGSRGNFSFTTLNLPMMAIEAHKTYPDNQEKAIKKFYELMDNYIMVSKRYLEKRYAIIAKKHVYNLPFLMGQGVWMDSEKLAPTDTIESVLKHASISIGFCGLAECLKELIGAHHGESEKAQKLGLEIVGHLRAMVDKFTEETHMNWTCFGTPAESTAGQFLRAARKRYGIIPGVTDREYFTNSSHVPVYYPIKAFKKIDIEAPYHELENAGHIAYVEMDGDPSKNVKAFEKLIMYMHDKNMGYFSINHPVDRDPVCGYTGIIENECPHCHRKEKETGHFTLKKL